MTASNPNFCSHKEFRAVVEVVRITDQYLHEAPKDAEITDFQANISIACVGCGASFGFRGAKEAIADFTQPYVIPDDATTLRAPLSSPAEMTIGGL